MGVIFGGITETGEVTVGSADGEFYLAVAYTDTTGCILKYDLTHESTGRTLGFSGKNGFDYDLDIDWGDGTTSTITEWNSSDWVHTYSTDVDISDITVELRGICGVLKFTTAITCLTDVISLGDLSWSNMDNMFVGCTRLKTVGCTRPLTLTGVSSLKQMFHQCKALTSVDMSKLHFGEVNTLSRMFRGCSNLDTLRMPTLTPSIYCQKFGMFEYVGVRVLDVRGIDFSKGKSCTGLMRGMSNVEYIYIDDIDLTGFSVYRCFKDCPNLLGIYNDLEHTKPFTFTGGDDLSISDEAFQNCPKLNMPISGEFYWSSGNISKHVKMFYGSHAIPNWSQPYNDGVRTYDPIPADWGGGYAEYYRAIVDGVDYIDNLVAFSAAADEYVVDNISSSAPSYSNSARRDVSSGDILQLATRSVIPDDYTVGNGGTATFDILGDGTGIIATSNGSIINLRILAPVNEYGTQWVWGRYSASEGGGTRLYDIEGRGRHLDVV